VFGLAICEPDFLDLIFVPLWNCVCAFRKAEIPWWSEITIVLNKTVYYYYCVTVYRWNIFTFVFGCVLIEFSPVIFSIISSHMISDSSVNVHLIHTKSYTSIPMHTYRYMYILHTNLRINFCVQLYVTLYMCHNNWHTRIIDILYMHTRYHSTTLPSLVVSRFLTCQLSPSSTS